VRDGVVLEARRFESTFMDRSVVSSYASGGEFLGGITCVAMRYPSNAILFHASICIVDTSIGWARDKSSNGKQWAARPSRARGRKPQPKGKSCVSTTFTPQWLTPVERPRVTIRRMRIKTRWHILRRSEGSKPAVKMTEQCCHRFRDNEIPFFRLDPHQIQSRPPIWVSDLH
jgi:hypothetical protein